MASKIKQCGGHALPPYRIDRGGLERDVVIETFRTGGPGGQHRNVTESAVRLVHLPSGVRVTAAESRSQHQNREIAFEWLARRLQALNRVARPRVPTRPRSGAVERRLREKHERQQLKRLRARIRDGRNTEDR